MVQASTLLTGAPNRTRMAMVRKPPCTDPGEAPHVDMDSLSRQMRSLIRSAMNHNQDKIANGEGNN